ncbi:MAG: hypothetical protein VX294_00970 [Candidatus Latescibacterota bacterium]|nr:hypothetical protein [Candidatus Latescibacterota bacterium]
MSSTSGRFTRLEKICVFLIAMGKERAREILAEMDVDTIQKINITMTSLGAVTALEKASVMIEFGDFFYKDIPLSSKLENTEDAALKKGEFVNLTSQDKPSGTSVSIEVNNNLSGGQTVPDEEKIISKALDSFKLYAPKINWRNAGYDFGEGYQGLDDKDR